MKCVVAMYNASANGEYTLSIPSKQWDFQVGNVSVQINGCVTLFENIRNKWRDIYIYVHSSHATTWDCRGRIMGLWCLINMHMFINFELPSSNNEDKIFQTSDITTIKNKTYRPFHFRE